MRAERQGTGKVALLILCLAFAPGGAAAQRTLAADTLIRTQIETGASGSVSASVARRGIRQSVQQRRGIRPIAVAKWSALAGAAGAAAYGFIRNGRADDLYRDLEMACNADRVVCALRTPEGAYAAKELEAMYQKVLDHDRTSQRALIASQVGVALGVVLFLIDLRSDERPADIPYEPRRIEIAPARDGGLALRATLPVRF